MKRTRRRPEEVLQNVKQFFKSRGRLPTVHEVQNLNGFLSAAGASSWFRKAEHEGWLTRNMSEGNRMISYSLTGGADAVAALNTLPTPSTNGNHAAKDHLGVLLKNIRRVLRPMPECAGLVNEIDDYLLG